MKAKPSFNLLSINYKNPYTSVLVAAVARNNIFEATWASKQNPKACPTKYIFKTYSPSFMNFLNPRDLTKINKTLLAHKSKIPKSYEISDVFWDVGYCISVVCIHFSIVF